MISSLFVENVSFMYINISYKFHRIPDRQSCFITKVHDLLGQSSNLLTLLTNVSIEANSADPDQTAPIGAV